MCWYISLVWQNLKNNASFYTSQQSYWMYGKYSTDCWKECIRKIYYRQKTLNSALLNSYIRNIKPVNVKKPQKYTPNTDDFSQTVKVCQTLWFCKIRYAITKQFRQEFYFQPGGQKSTWSQELYRCWYVKPTNPEKTNRNNRSGSVGKSYSHVHEG